MTTSINSINAGTTSATDETKKKSQLSESTKKELEAYGISVSDSMTEAEAQQMIRQARQEKNPENSKQGYSSEFDVKADAKSLAAELGISVSDDADVADILNDIGSEIENLLDEVESNPSILSTISGYLSKLTNLDQEYDSIISLESGYNNAVNMVAINNKIALGLE